MERVYESAAETAKKVRAALKVEFPGIKFSVRSDNYSGGSSVHVSWTDGPTHDAVDAVLNRFESASFDGMQDLKTTHGYMYEGKLYSGADWVTGQRDISDEYRAQVEAYMPEGVTRQDWEYHGHFTQAEQRMIEAESAPVDNSTLYVCSECGFKTTDKNKMQDHESYHEETTSAPAEPVDGVTVTYNEDKNGIEIRFASKPAAGVIEMLKENGFRWSRWNGGFWWAKRTPERVTLAEALTIPAPVEMVEQSQPAPDMVNVTIATLNTRDTIELNRAHVTDTTDKYPTIDHDAVKCHIESREQWANGDYAYSINGLDFDYVPPKTPQTFADGERVPMSRIVFTWSECGIVEGGEMFTTWNNANQFIRRIERAHVAEYGLGGGYYKTGFIVCFDDGYTYGGRMDVNEKDNDMIEHIRDFNEFHAGMRKPSHMSQQDYDNIINGWGAEYVQPSREFLARYIIGDDTTAPNETRTTAEVIPFTRAIEKKVDRWFDQLTPVQRLKLHTLKTLLDEDTISDAIANGISVDQLFEVTANAADWLNRVEAKQQN